MSVTNNPNDPTTQEQIIKISTSDIPTVLASHAKRLKWQIEHLGHRRGLTVPFFLSFPGAGKSESQRFVAEEMLKRQLFDVRCGNILPSDVRLPVAVHEEKTSTYYGNSELPFLSSRVGEDASIYIHWDELPDAPLPIMRIVKQAMNDNCIGGLHFPMDTLQAASGNGMEHGCFSERIPLSNANRLAWYEVGIDIDSFLQWVEDRGIYPELQACVQNNMDIPYDIAQKVSDWDGKSNFASFRSLEEVGKMINAEYIKETGTPDDDDYRRELIPTTMDPLFKAKLNAIVGFKAANKIASFFLIFEAIGSIDDLLADPDGCKIPSDIPKKWVIACKLVGVATAKNLNAVMKIAERLSGKKGFMEAYIAKAIGKAKPKLGGEPALRGWMTENTLELCGRG
jgi:hypothetical protein